MKISYVSLIIIGLVIGTKAFPQDNHPPQVSFVKPAKSSSVKAHGTVDYSIEVKDAEDGFSGYQEIPAHEVFLRVGWISDKNQLATYQSESKKFERVYPMIAANGCLNCHALRQKLAGPSFEQVTEKYSKFPGAVSMLAAKIRNGSKGVWGDSQQMPAHPAISESDAQSLVRWIFRYAPDKNFQCLPGLEGSVSVPGISTGFFVFTALYTDHGLNGSNTTTGTSMMLLPVFK